MITDRLRALFTSKLAKMGKAIQSVGETGHAKLLDNWKETKWLLELKDTEIIPTNRKRNPDHLVAQSFHQKFAKLEEKVKEANDKFKEANDKFKEANHKFKEANDKFKEANDKFKEANHKLKDISNELKCVRKSNKKLAAKIVRSGDTRTPKITKAGKSIPLSTKE